MRERSWVGRLHQLVPCSETHLVLFPAFDELGLAMPVAPRDVGEDGPSALFVVPVIGVVEREVSDAREDRFDPIQPRRVGRREHELDVVVGGPGSDFGSLVGRKVIEDEVEARRERVACANVRMARVPEVSPANQKAPSRPTPSVKPPWRFAHTRKITGSQPCRPVTMSLAETETRKSVNT